MQRKSFRFDKNVCVGKTLNLGIFALNLGGILREFGDSLGKYRILDGRPLGSIACCYRLLQPECKLGELLAASVFHLVTSQHDVTNQIEDEISKPVLRILSKIETDGFFCP